MALSHFIYIYIYCHPRTDYFVVSLLFSVDRHVSCFKLSSKPGWLYISRISYPTPIVNLKVSKGYFYTHTHTHTHIYIYIYIYIFAYTLSATGVLNSREELYIYAYVAVNYSQLECSTHWAGEAYILTSTDYIVVSQVFSVSRHVIYFKLRSKPDWLYLSRISYTRATVILIDIVTYMNYDLEHCWNTGLRNRSKQVWSRIAQLPSVSDKYSCVLNYRLKSTATLHLQEWLWHWITPGGLKCHI